MKVLIRVIPKSSGEDDTTCLLLALFLSVFLLLFPQDLRKKPLLPRYPSFFLFFSSCVFLSKSLLASCHTFHLPPPRATHLRAVRETAKNNNNPQKALSSSGGGVYNLLKKKL